MIKRLTLIVASAAVLGTFSHYLFANNSEPVSPIVAQKITNPEMVELGKMLFFDPRLSKSGFISCNSCHNLSMGGTDNLPASIGHSWQKGSINSPTVLNSSMSLAQFWDGRASNLKEQAGGPIANPAEMASTHDLAVEILKTIPGYRDKFKNTFGSDEINIDKVTAAIAAFEETLVTPNSRFDLWLKGDKKALNKQELAGYQLFKESGCVACHYGPALGGTSFQKLGLFGDYAGDKSLLGRFGVTGDENDRFSFKVPTLRNIELTYPYFHDGSVKTLADAVNIMGRLQLDRNFTSDETTKIVAFLKTLTGDQPSFKLPILPPSSESTPQPQPFSK